MLWARAGASTGEPFELQKACLRMVAIAAFKAYLAGYTSPAEYGAKIVACWQMSNSDACRALGSGTCAVPPAIR